MLSGYMFQTYKKDRQSKSSIFFHLLLILLFLSAVTYFGLHNDANCVLMAKNHYGNYLYFFISAFSGIIMSVSLSIIIAKYTTKLSKLMQKIGSDTMLIFILHKYPLILINDVFILIPVAHISNYIIIPVYLIFALIVCMPISSFIKKQAPILIGK